MARGRRRGLGATDDPFDGPGDRALPAVCAASGRRLALVPLDVAPGPLALPCGRCGGHVVPTPRLALWAGQGAGRMVC